jgi:hypothetical protein
MFVSICDILKGLIIPAYVLSHEIVGGLNRLHVGLERGIVFVLIGYIFAVNSSAGNVFHLDKTLPSTFYTRVAARDYGEHVIRTTP